MTVREWWAHWRYPGDWATLRAEMRGRRALGRVASRSKQYTQQRRTR